MAIATARLKNCRAIARGSPPVLKYAPTGAGSVQTTSIYGARTQPRWIASHVVITATSGAATKGGASLPFITTGAPKSSGSLMLKSAGTIPARPTSRSCFDFAKSKSSAKASVTLAAAHGGHVLGQRGEPERLHRRQHREPVHAHQPQRAVDEHDDDHRRQRIAAAQERPENGGDATGQVDAEDVNDEPDKRDAGEGRQEGGEAADHHVGRAAGELDPPLALVEEVQRLDGEDGGGESGEEAGRAQRRHGQRLVDRVLRDQEDGERGGRAGDLVGLAAFRERERGRRAGVDRDEPGAGRISREQRRRGGQEAREPRPRRLSEQQKEAAEQDKRQAAHHAVAHGHEVRLFREGVAECLNAFPHRRIVESARELRQFDTLRAPRY